MTKVEGQGLLRWSRRTWEESTRAVHKNWQDGPGIN